MLKFWKMQALGNDFVILDGIQTLIKPENIRVMTLCDRHFGIGCDQFIIIEKSQIADFRARFFNADGSEAEQCGNGVRCLAEYLSLTKQLSATKFTLETKAGIVTLFYESSNSITVNMGLPEFEPSKIPLVCKSRQHLYGFELDDLRLEGAVLSMGNPHAIIKVDELQDFDVAKFGSKISQLPMFPNSTNVGFVEGLNTQKIKLRTYERGVGETHACGTNACAAAVAGIVQGYVTSPVVIQLTYGTLSIEWAGPGHPVFMTGPAFKVFEGSIDSTASSI